MIKIKNRSDLANFKHVSGIYMFNNKINNKKYIGQAVDLNARLLYHLSCIRRGNTHTHVLYKAIAKYGFENFEIFILTTFPPHNKLKHNLNLVEQIYIQFYNSYRNGYNATLGGDGGCLGYRKTEEQRKRMSDYMKSHCTLNHQIFNKHIYLYNFIKHYRVDYKSVAEACVQLKDLGYNIHQNSLSQNARGKTHRVSDFITAYSEQELDVRIKQFDEYIKTNKYKTFSPDYESYFNYLLTIADDDGFIPAAKCIGKMLGVSKQSIQAWNRHLDDKIKTVRIGTIDRKQIINYNEYKSKKTK